MGVCRRGVTNRYTVSSWGDQKILEPVLTAAQPWESTKDDSRVCFPKVILWYVNHVSIGQEDPYR